MPRAWDWKMSARRGEDGVKERLTSVSAVGFLRSSAYLGIRTAPWEWWREPWEVAAVLSVRASLAAGAVTRDMVYRLCDEDAGIDYI
jgi:hypothetical protein